MLAPIQFRVTRPLLSLAASIAITNPGQRRTFLDHVEEGRVLAFDIASPGAKCRCLRIHAGSLRDYLAGQSRNQITADFGAQVAGIFPALAETLGTQTLCRLFDCDKKLILAHAERGLLAVAREGRRGNGGTQTYTRAGCIQFLRERRVC